MTDYASLIIGQTDLAAIKWDKDGLISAIIQDADTDAVLTLAYMNRESLQKSLDIGQTVFWSRSRQALWHKGETSGHIQHIVSMALDCDGDALLVRVRPVGPACHTGETTCFHRALSDFTPKDTP
ncbi:MAG: phosphoribosyl-AMP cyclohydrolase [Anaerolineae bacterium]|jgi:phosphoribosyl-ATP pyrophosphohydrolase/phosphoribosyl-AMP cyclohydrolase|nr:phosphoribosyl-AMP cyclohydrolase [Anaerolineae bacterium]